MRRCFQIYNTLKMIEAEFTPDALVLMFLFMTLGLAICLRQLQHKIPALPYTPTLFIISILLGLWSDYLGVVGASLKATAQIDPRGILIIFLPPLIFQSSFNSDWYVFRKQSSQVAVLAFPSVVVSAFILMLALKTLLGFDDSYYTYTSAFMFGAVLSCTDTVAVLALLKEAGAPRRFSSLIEGESLLNDGSCMILMTISLELCKGSSLALTDIISLFLQLAGGAIVLGTLFGVVATLLVKLFKHDGILCFNVTFSGCYLLYFCAEYVDFGVKVSGIMALVSMGLYMAAFARTKFTPDSQARVHSIWKIIVFAAETIIFCLGGVVVGVNALRNPELIDLISFEEVLKLLGLYVCMGVARFVGIACFMPKLRKWGYGLTWSEVLALTYGGLRGAVGIAFTLILAANEDLPLKFRLISVFNMVGCALLTMVINAPTCRTVITALGLCKKTDIKITLFRRFVKRCAQFLEDKLQQVKRQSIPLNTGQLNLSKQFMRNESRVSLKPNMILHVNKCEAKGSPVLGDIEPPIDLNGQKIHWPTKTQPQNQQIRAHHPLAQESQQQLQAPKRMSPLILERIGEDEPGMPMTPFKMVGIAEEHTDQNHSIHNSNILAESKLSQGREWARQLNKVNINWIEALRKTGIHEIMEKVVPSSDQEMRSLSKSLLSDEESDLVEESTMAEVRGRFNVSLKGVLWRKFEAKQCSDEALRRILESVNLDSDSLDSPLASWDYLIDGEKLNPVIGWLRGFRLLESIVLSYIFRHVSCLYEVVSTYIEAMKECIATCQQLPFGQATLKQLNAQATHQQSLAEHYLEYEVNRTYPDVVARVQTYRMAWSLLSHQLESLEKSYKAGRIDECYYREIKIMYEHKANELENISIDRQPLTCLDCIKSHSLLGRLSTEEQLALAESAVESAFQRGQLVLRAYESLRWVYLVSRGQVSEKWVMSSGSVHKRKAKQFEVVGLSEVLRATNWQYTVEADSACVVWALSSASVAKMVTSSPSRANQAYRSVAMQMILTTPTSRKRQITEGELREIVSRLEYLELGKKQVLALGNKRAFVIEGKLSSRESSSATKAAQRVQAGNHEGDKIINPIKDGDTIHGNEEYSKILKGPCKCYLYEVI